MDGDLRLPTDDLEPRRLGPPTGVACGKRSVHEGLASAGDLLDKRLAVLPDAPSRGRAEIESDSIAGARRGLGDREALFQTAGGHLVPGVEKAHLLHEKAASE